MIYAVILSGGSGTRMGPGGTPKQFLPIAGTPVLIHAMRPFLDCAAIDRLYLAVHPDWLGHTAALLRRYFPSADAQRVRIVAGGPERLASFERAVAEIERSFGFGRDDYLVCHDAVRPFVRRSMIEACIAAAEEHRFSLTAIPVADTVHVSGGPGFLEETMDRSRLFRGQTPSCFHAQTLLRILGACGAPERAAATGTTQLVLRAGYRIRLVPGSADNFKITTEEDLRLADRIARGARENAAVRLLDCTLRDGGIAIDFRFGAERMCRILSCLARAGADYIECGYLDSRSAGGEGVTSFRSVTDAAEALASAGKQSGVRYVAMVDYGAYDVHLLPDAAETGLDGIRLAFHKEHRWEALDWGRTILDRGYRLFLQPMVTPRYQDAELQELISECGRLLPEAEAFYIVDSFGQMDPPLVTHQTELADDCLAPGIRLGFHAHNNRQLAFANALAFLHVPARHERILDASIAGMGKGAGNLCTELAIPELNAAGGRYDAVAVYEEIARDFRPMMERRLWGYSLEYYLSSVYRCSPSYVKLFLADRRVTTDHLVRLLERMPEEKRAACDRSFAGTYLRAYFEEQERP